MIGSPLLLFFPPFPVDQARIGQGHSHRTAVQTSTKAECRSPLFLGILPVKLAGSNEKLHFQHHNTNSGPLRNALNPSSATDADVYIVMLVCSTARPMTALQALLAICREGRSRMIPASTEAALGVQLGSNMGHPLTGSASFPSRNERIDWSRLG